jgi:hypothetical protein
VLVTNIAAVIEVRIIPWADHVARMRETINAESIILEGWRILAQPRYRWKDSLITDVIEVARELVGWLELVGVFRFVYLSVVPIKMKVDSERMVKTVVSSPFSSYRDVLRSVSWKLAYSSCINFAPPIRYARVLLFGIPHRPDYFLKW